MRSHITSGKGALQHQQTAVQDDMACRADQPANTHVLLGSLRTVLSLNTPSLKCQADASTWGPAAAPTAPACPVYGWGTAKEGAPAGRECC